MKQKRPEKRQTSKAQTARNAHLDVVMRATEDSKYMLFGKMVEEPLPKCTWTTSLAGYAEARDSAVNALHRLYAATENAQHIFCSPIDRFLWQLGVGLRHWNDPEILEIIAVAQNLSRSAIFEEIHTKLQNLKKRVKREYGGVDISLTGFSDLNVFRVFLAEKWIRWMFWLMPDELIATTVTSTKLKPNGCNRQTISEAVKQMGLVKCPGKPIVKRIGSGGIFEFESGYPTQG